MSTGQALLAMAALSLFMYTAVNVNRLYVASVSESVDKQRTSDAINYAQSVAEMLYAQGQFYDDLDINFGHLDNENLSTRRLETLSVIGDSLVATVELDAESAQIHGAVGRTATIRVFSLLNDGTTDEQVSLMVTLLRPVAP
ncbi:MAG: hypothetical protein HLUCCA01_12840 [Bacteroidetes bacterium HLUCCA01]|nr:MAG: hypothetical protein HLUCCA01_12840 [Bacteroidetes bacterium HLUCCA01]